MIITFW